MEISLTHELVVFASMIFGGVGQGFLFDFFKTIRNLFFKKKLFGNFVDILYWVFAAVAFGILILYFNNGEIRLFMIVGLLLGLIFYFFLFSKYVTALFSMLFVKILKIFQLILKILLTPTTFLYKIIIGFVVSLFCGLKKRLRHNKSVLKKFRVRKLRIKNDKKEK